MSAQSFCAFGQLVECSFTNKMSVVLGLIAVPEASYFAPLWGNETLNIQTTKDCVFNLKFVSD